MTPASDDEERSAPGARKRRGQPIQALAILSVLGIVTWIAVRFIDSTPLLRQYWRFFPDSLIPQSYAKSLFSYGENPLHTVVRKSNAFFLEGLLASPGWVLSRGSAPISLAVSCFVSLALLSVGGYVLARHWPGPTGRLRAGLLAVALPLILLVLCLLFARSFLPTQAQLPGLPDISGTNFVFLLPFFDCFHYVTVAGALAMGGVLVASSSRLTRRPWRLAIAVGAVCFVLGLNDLLFSVSVTIPMMCALLCLPLGNGRAFLPVAWRVLVAQGVAACLAFASSMAIATRGDLSSLSATRSFGMISGAAERFLTPAVILGGAVGVCVIAVGVLWLRKVRALGVRSLLVYCVAQGGACAMLFLIAGRSAPRYLLPFACTVTMALLCVVAARMRTQWFASAVALTTVLVATIGFAETPSAQQLEDFDACWVSATKDREVVAASDFSQAAALDLSSKAGDRVVAVGILNDQENRSLVFTNTDAVRDKDFTAIVTYPEALRGSLPSYDPNNPYSPWDLSSRMDVPPDSVTQCTYYDILWYTPGGAGHTALNNYVAAWVKASGS